MADFYFFTSAELLVGPSHTCVCNRHGSTEFLSATKANQSRQKEYPSHTVIRTAQKTQSHQKLPYSSSTFCSVKHEKGRTSGGKPKVTLALL